MTTWAASVSLLPAMSHAGRAREALMRRVREPRHQHTGIGSVTLMTMFLRALTTFPLTDAESLPGQYAPERSLRVDVHGAPVVAARPLLHTRTETKAMQDVDAERRPATVATVTKADRDRDQTTAAITKLGGGRDSDEEPSMALLSGWTWGGRDRDQASAPSACMAPSRST